MLVAVRVDTVPPWNRGGAGNGHGAGPLAQRTSAEKDTCQMVVTPGNRRERIRRQLLKA